MTATNVTKIQIRLFLEDSQQLETSIYKKIKFQKIIFRAQHKSNTTA